MKPSQGPSSPAVSSPAGIVTHKEWVIPPRPKPGRKPAVDTPPTKRKAQNRAAQRAFRERRAARVGELEERIKEIEEEDAAKSKEMEAQVRQLQHDVERFKDEVAAWKERCELLDRILEQERKGKEKISRAYDGLRERHGRGSENVVPLPARPGRRQDRTSNVAPQRDFHAPHEEEIELVGCGNCTKDTHCECVAQAIISYPTDSFTNASKRPHSPQITLTSDTTKRLRNADPADLETDFTDLYSSNKRTSHLNISSATDSDTAAAANGNNNAVPTSLSPDEIDNCGFCQDGTPCICADLSLVVSPNNNKPKQIPPLLPQFTPPPSDTDVALPFSPDPQRTLPPLKSATAAKSCANGPGTCSQCRADPNSTLFCKSLAAIRNSNNNNGGKAGSPASPPSGCCGGSVTNGGACCRDPANNSAAVTLSCADTYQTLSRHPGYEQASDEFGSWLNRLNTSSATTTVSGRPPMEVEAASVMGVLKLFDRRFGRG
ncbi:MAG: hypothetical protein M1839_002954 [Geoglossum umbratile]|nr:MAG: hypothetical protein M1839_002954 [Geoglossum umbratile]